MTHIPLHERQYDDYVVNVRLDRAETSGGTIVVNFFLGEVPTDPCDWEKTPKIGVVTFMGGGSMGRMGGGGENQQCETGQISLTNQLLDLIESRQSIGGDVLRSLDREEVGRFLEKHMHWRVQSMGQKEVPLRDVPSLRVFVAACTATLPEADDEFIQYGKYEIVGSATKGRLCGFDPEVDTL